MKMLKPLKITSLTRILVLIGACILSFFDGLGQTTIVTGKVFDAVTNEPLPFVNLAFQGSKIGTTTDIEGNYRIETYYATDSLVASFVGYLPLVLAVEKDVEQTLDFPLKTGEVQLDVVEIKYEKTENPAHPIIRNVIQNKKINNRDKLLAYDYEVYNKIEFDLNNIDSSFMQRRVMKPFEFVFEYVDTTEAKPFLPLFITESISNYYYRKNPKSEKEIIHATQVSGVENQSVSQFLGDMYQNVNIYRNYIDAFGRSFVSPISDFGFVTYRYYLTDSSFIDNQWCYKIQFQPKRKHELTFKGEMWVHDTTYAIKQVEATISGDANINFITEFSVRQEYDQVEHEVWMLTKDQLVVDFNLADKAMGFYGRKTTTYDDFHINTPREDKFYSDLDNIEVADDANEKSKEFWDNARHEELTEKEKAIYHMVDTIRDVPAFRTYVDVVQMLITGYKEWGLVEIGPYFSMYSFNQVEGHRFRLGVRTSNSFSTRTMIETYAAYGTLDNRWKYGGEIMYFLKKSKPRNHLGMSFTDDVEQLGQSENAIGQDNILASALRRNPANRLNRFRQWQGYYDIEYFQGLSNRITFTNKSIWPLGDLNFVYTNSDGAVLPKGNLVTSEISLMTRFAYKEKYVSGDFDRVSLGTAWPIFALTYSYGIPNLLDSEYEYHKLVFNMNDRFVFNPFGHSDVVLEAGKYWGELPYPLLELHNGNETYTYDVTAFNLMNYYEFVSDQYVSLSWTHHFNGLFLNKVPLIRKLKWREVAYANGVWGSLQDENRIPLNFPQNLFTLDVPYYEAGVGIENILKLIRVDALWRLAYLDNPGITKFGVRAMLQFQF